MCTSRIRVVMGLVVGALGLGGSVGRAATTTCPDGRYLVFRQTLLGQAASDMLDGLTVRHAAVALDSGCPSQPAHVTSNRAGTKIAASWDRCGTAENVRLRAVVTGASCDVVNGSVSARQQPTRPFTGRRSSCGDGVVDTAAGESCEHDGDCGAGSVCGSQCTCDVLPTTTTTTLPPTVRLQVAVDPPNSGVVTGPGITCGRDEFGVVYTQCASDLPPESATSFHAAPSAANGRFFEFDGWTGCQHGPGGYEDRCSGTMHGDQVVVARFARSRHYRIEAAQSGGLDVLVDGGSCFWSAYLGSALDITVIDAGGEAHVKSEGELSVGVGVDNVATPDLACGQSHSASTQWTEEYYDWVVRATPSWAEDLIYLKAFFPLSAVVTPPALSGFVKLEGTIGADDVLHATLRFTPNYPVGVSGAPFEATVTVSPSP